MRILIILMLAVMASCSRTENAVSEFDVPSNLKDCEFSKVATNSGIRYIFVVRCPNSTTTTAFAGKPQDTVTVMDGEKTPQVKDMSDEALRKQQAKLSALLKLSMDEREALGY